MNDWGFSPPPESALRDHDVPLTGNHLDGKRIALLLTVPEAEQRIARNYIDHTEMHDEELADALDSAQDIM